MNRLVETTLASRETPKASDHRLRKHADYQRVYKAGRKKHSRGMSYFSAMRAPEAAGTEALHGPRIGLTVPKALGKAVTRNRIKRRMRAAIRTVVPLLTAPVDVVLHPRKTAAACPFAALEQEIVAIFRAIQASSGQANAVQARPIHRTPGDRA